jgi:hypothetical protein
MAMNFFGKLVRPTDIILKDGKIQVIETFNRCFEIYVNHKLVKTIRLVGSETPTAEEIFAVLQDIGIDPDQL